MKRSISTIVLVILLLLTVVALKRIELPRKLVTTPTSYIERVEN